MSFRVNNLYKLLALFPVVTWAITASDVDRAISRLDDLMQELLKKTGVPSISAAVVYNDSNVYSHATGLREVGTNQSVSPETVYQLASLSKPISSTIVSALVGDGYLNWTSAANDLDIMVQLSDPWITQEVTVADFFAHRSGLFGGAGLDLESFGFNTTEILTKLKYLDPTGDFRITYQYSNYGITAGAFAAASAAGMEWAELAQNRLYKRLNMSSTSSSYKDFETLSNRASLHVLPGNGTNTSAPFVPAPPRNPDAQSPAGGVTSNVLDLANWLRLLLQNGTFGDDRIVDEEPLLYSQLPHIMRGLDPTSGLPGFYGLGWNVDYDAPTSGRVFLGHAGAFTAGARSVVRLNNLDGLGIVVLSNCFPTGVPEAIAYTFFDWVYYGNETRDWLSIWDGLYDTLNAELVATDPAFDSAPPDPLPPSAGNDTYVGVYANDYVGHVTISPLHSAGFPNQNLNISIGDTAWNLSHWTRDVYVMRSELAFPDAPFAANFHLGPDGKANQLYLSVLDGDGMGLLDRVG